MFDEAYDSTSTCGDKRHWLVSTLGHAVQFDSQDSLFDFYVEILAPAVASEEEARKRIYLASCGPAFGFGAEMDKDTQKKLGDLHDACVICEDCYYNKNASDQFAGQTAAQFTPLNKNFRLDNIFRYHYLSERNSRWNFDHWLIIPKRSDVGLALEQRAAHCVKILTDVLGSADEAKARIYIIWFKAPIGFAAKIDKETSEKLKGRPDVLEVLPDYAFDVLDMHTCFGHRVLFIMSR